MMLNTLLMYMAPLARGATLTVLVWLGAAVCSLIVGVIFGVIRCKPVRVPWLSTIVDALTAVLRGVPFYVQLLIAYFVLPDLLGVRGDAVLIATGCLGLCSAAYVSQIVVSGINAIAPAQWEMAQVLGYSLFEQVRFVVLPQVMRSITPALCGECDQLLKSTSIFSAIGIMELTGVARNIIARDLNPIPVYLLLACLYLLCSCAMAWLVGRLERRMRYGQN